MPLNPLITKGGMMISGSATVHNPEGHSTIWSGDEIDLGSNNSTSTNVPDIGHSNYPDCMNSAMTCTLASSSNRLITGVDVITSDSSLGALTPAEFFRNFLGLPPTAYRSSMVTLETTPQDHASDAHLATQKVVWVEGNTLVTGMTVGCNTALYGSNVCPGYNTKPSILIINGNASFSGNSHIYGLLFVSGDVHAGGNTTIHGAMVIGGNLTSSAGSSLDVWYNSDVLEDTTKAGHMTGASGTWKDF